MKHCFSLNRALLAAVLTGLASLPLRAADLKPIEPAEVKLDRPVDFEKDVYPILEANCVACHNSAIPESKLSVEDVPGIMKGGKRGPAVVAKEPDKSLLYQVAARGKEPLMPPLPNQVEADALTPQQLGILRQWILEGAATGSGGMGPSLVQWQALPEDLNAIHSVALSPWGRFAAVGRANKVALYDVVSRQYLTRLSDPALAEIRQEDGSPMYLGDVAHRDFVHALAFNHDGSLLASGGYRVVKLWQRPEAEALRAAVSEAVTAVSVSADGKLAAVAAGNTIQLINTADGKPVRSLDGHGGKVTAVYFWPTVQDKAAAAAGVTTAQTNLQNAVKQAAAAEEALQTFDPQRDKLDQSQAAEKRQQLQTALDNARKGIETATAAVQSAVEAQKAFDQQAASASKLLSASEDKTTRIWNPLDGAPLGQIDTPAAVNDVVVNNDATKVITAGADNIIRVWASPATADERPEKPAVEINGHGQPVTSLDFIRTAGNQVASGGLDGTLRIWNIDNGSQVRSFSHGGPVVDVAVRPDGQQLASAGENNLAKLWNINGQQIAELKGDLEHQRTVAVLTDDQTVAKQLVALADAAQKEAEKNEKDREEGLKKAAEAVTAAEKALNEAQEKAKKADEALAAAKAELEKKPDDAGLKKKVEDAQKAADTEQGNLTKATDGLDSAKRTVTRGEESVQRAKEKHEQAKQQKQAADEHQKQADEKLAAAQKAVPTDQPVRGIVFSTNGKLVFTTGDDHRVHVWDAETGQQLDVWQGHQAAVAGLASGPDDRVVSGSADKNVVVWRANPEWKLVGVIGPQGEDRTDVSNSRFVDRVMSLDFSRDGKFLATGGGEPSRSGELLIWDVEKRELVREIADAHSDSIFGLEFSRDGKFILSGAADKFVKVHEVESGKHVRSFEGHTHHVMDVSWKADGSSIVSAGADNAIKVWNTETGEQNRTISNYSKQVTSIQFVGTGEDVISCGGDTTVRFHRTTNGQNVRSFSGASDYMYAAVSTPDQKLVIAGGEDGVLRLWNGTNGQSIATFEPPVAVSTEAGAENTQASASSGP